MIFIFFSRTPPRWWPPLSLSVFNQLIPRKNVTKLLLITLGLMRSIKFTGSGMVFFTVPKTTSRWVESDSQRLLPKSRCHKRRSFTLADVTTFALVLSQQIGSTNLKPTDILFFQYINWKKKGDRPNMYIFLPNSWYYNSATFKFIHSRDPVCVTLGSTYFSTRCFINRTSSTNWSWWVKMLEKLGLVLFSLIK